MRVLLSLAVCSLLPLAGQSLSGRRAPSFSLPDSTMTQHDILDFRGHWVLLDFMKTDCPHCKALSKVLENVKREFGTKVAILSVVIAPPENTTTVAKYKQETGSTVPIVFDQGQVAVSYFKATPAHPSFDTPHLFVIDPAGKIVQDWSDGAQQGKDILEHDGLSKELRSLMAAKK
jgi:peroxiredoxin